MDLHSDSVLAGTVCTQAAESGIVQGQLVVSFGGISGLVGLVVHNIHRPERLHRQLVMSGGEGFRLLLCLYTPTLAVVSFNQVHVQCTQSYASFFCPLRKTIEVMHLTSSLRNASLTSDNFIHFCITNVFSCFMSGRKMGACITISTTEQLPDLSLVGYQSPLENSKRGQLNHLQGQLLSEQSS